MCFKNLFSFCIPATLLFILFLLLPFCQEKETERQELELELPKAVAAQERYQQEFEKTKDPKLNAVPSERLEIARKYVQRLIDEGRAIGNVNWQERGPNNVGGRTRSILVDAGDNTNNTVFAGSVSGGLWRTTNFQNVTPTWVAIDPFFDNIAISCITQDPNNTDILYFGTGEGWFNSDAFRGLGIWKSTDGGNTWTHLTSTTSAPFYYIQDIIVDNSGNVYAATREGGVRRSTDGGSSWTQVLGSSVGEGSTNRAADLELGADGAIYASLGIFSAGAVFRSDTGAAGTWDDITPAGSFWRIEIATAPSDATRIYVLCQGDGSYDVTNMYRSSSRGNNWTPITVPDFCDQGSTTVFTRSQAWYDLIALVAPDNANRLYIGGVDALRSDDGGSTWEQISSWTGGFQCSGLMGNQYVHADHHMMVFENGANARMILGTDGGISHTTNSTASPPDFIDKNTGYNVTQFYACAIHPAVGSNYFLAGSQDNGTQQFTVAGMNNTSQVTGGDGAFCHIDQDNPDIQITSYVYNNYWVSTDGGANFVTRFFSNSGSFINPADYDDDTDILYAGNSSGSYFRWNVPTSVGASTADVLVTGLGTVTAVATSPNIDNRVYFGDSNGNVLIVDDAHTGTYRTGITILDELGSVSCIAIEEGNENHILVTYSNYGVISIFETTNGGSSWTNIEGNLPDMPVRWVIFNPENSDQALVATELGVWSTDNLNGTATEWGITNTNLANVRVDMLQYRTSDGLIAAATHGRGLFTAMDYGSNCVATLTINDNPIASGTYLSSDKIISSGGVPSGNDVVFDAKNSVTLNPDFHADQGSSFLAKAGGGCTASLVSDDDRFAELSEVITIKEYNDKQLDFALYPIPATHEVTISCSLSEATEVLVTLHDQTGKFISVIQPKGRIEKGNQQFTFNATEMEAGMYYVVMSTDKVRKSQKLVVMR